MINRNENHCFTYSIIVYFHIYIRIDVKCIDIKIYISTRNNFLRKDSIKVSLLGADVV